MPNPYKKLLMDVATARIVNRTVTQLLPSWVTVFMLHRIKVPGTAIRGIERQYLIDCLEYLCDRGFEFIALEDAVTRARDDSLAKKPWVAFSLDDGYFDQVEVAGEIFHRFDCPSTVFLITDFIDGKSWPWDQMLVHVATHARNRRISIHIDDHSHELNFDQPYAYRPAIELIRRHAPRRAYEAVAQIAEAAGVAIPAEPPEEFRPASWDAVRRMEQKGMQFAAHSLSHRLLAGLNDAELEQEITQSVARVRQECRRPAEIFCYPIGKRNDFDNRSHRHLTALGLQGAFSAEPGFVSSPQLRRDPGLRFALPRMTIPEDFAQFKLSVSWAQYLREHL